MKILAKIMMGNADHFGLNRVSDSKVRQGCQTRPAAYKSVGVFDQQCFTHKKIPDIHPFVEIRIRVLP